MPLVGSVSEYFTLTTRAVASYTALSMLTLYLAAFSSFWFQCTRSGATALPGVWQPAQALLGMSVAVARGSLLPFSTKCVAYQSEPGLLAWQVRQASRLGLVFQLSPWGVFGLAAEWHLVQLRRSCGKPTSAKSTLVSR